MSTMSHECQLFQEDLASVIDGEPEALARHVAHLVHCDECRDARHDARVVARAVGRAGDGLPTGDAFIALLLGAVEAGRAPGADLRAAPKEPEHTRPRRPVDLAPLTPSSSPTRPQARPRPESVSRNPSRRQATWSGEQDPVATRSLGLAEPDDVPIESNVGTPYGATGSMGESAQNARDALMGDDVGENFGYGGLGLRGGGRGGGGTGEGTIGLGHPGSSGRGAGGGTGAGYGRGVGGLRGRASSVPNVRAGTSDVHGSMSREVIRRVVRSHMNEIRFCYEQQLAGRPDLAGRVAVNFIIAPSGRVQSAVLAGSTLGSATAEECMARAVRRWSFPAPEGGGIVAVTYPFMLSSASEGTEAGPSAPSERTGPALGPTGRPLGNGRFVRRTRLRTWERRATIAVNASVRAGEHRAVTEAEAALRERPDSRDRHRDLVRALARAGAVDRALTLAEAWVDKDPLDTAGIAALADALARVGRRDDAVRMLSGAVDAAPDDKGLHQRLATVFDRLGATELACAHRESLAELSPADPAAAEAAVRCERTLGRPESAARVLAHVADAAVRARVEEAAGRGAAPPPASGDLVVEARWEGGADLDLGIVGPRGARFSWLGGRSTIGAHGAISRDHERLTLRHLPVGGFLVELARSSAAGPVGPVRGQLEIRALGQRRVVPFVLDGARATVARVDVNQVEVVTPLF
jgi:TonB family protein